MLVEFFLIVSLLASARPEIPTRFEFSLNGVWKFRLSPNDEPNKGFEEEWWNTDFRCEDDALDMPVPSSFNDITTDPSIRDFIGWVWYQRMVTLPQLAEPKGNILLHFGSAEFYTRAWIDDDPTELHVGGHVPFYFDITELATNSIDGVFRLTVAVNNTLSENTLPQGSLKFVKDSDDYQYKTYSHNFDYFDYAGLNGGVHLELTPWPRIYRIEMRNIYYNKEADKGNVNFRAYISGRVDDQQCRYTATDWKGRVVFDSQIIHCEESFLNGEIVIDMPELWWPRETFDKSRVPGRMYTLHLYTYKGAKIWDKISTKFGVRTISSNASMIMINGEPVYLKGFGMHQDAELRGRGFDPVHLVRDMNLLKWTGANAIRTSHYPYAKDFLDMADSNGLMVILETPACSLNFPSDHEGLLSYHTKVFEEIYSTYNSHPSIIAWSLANEPMSNNPNSSSYFKSLVEFAKIKDTSRLYTFVTSQHIVDEKAMQIMDLICLNRYEGWYSLGGRLDLVEHHIGRELRGWQGKYQKPVILTEYGAEAISGYHSLPSNMWTENYQIELLKEHFKAFDSLRQDGELAGEMVWNFADFKVPQEYFRAEYCNKGIFTRNRQPKGAAYTVKKRYTDLVNKESSIPAVTMLP